MRKRPVPEVFKDVKKLHRLGYTNSRLATLLGVSETTIRIWRRRGEMPEAYYDKLQEIIKRELFGISPSEDLAFRHDDADDE
jgi:hypothetical protein